MGTQRVQMRGVIPWFFCWACRAGTSDFCSALAALVGHVQNIISSPYTISIFCSIAQQARQAALLGRLSLSMSLCMDGKTISHRLALLK